MPEHALKIVERTVLSVGEWRVAGWPIIAEEDGSATMQVSIRHKDQPDDTTRRVQLKAGATFDVGSQTFEVHRIVVDANPGYTVITPAP